MDQRLFIWKESKSAALSGCRRSGEDGAPLTGQQEKDVELEDRTYNSAIYVFTVYRTQESLPRNFQDHGLGAGGISEEGKSLRLRLDFFENNDDNAVTNRTDAKVR